MDMSMKVSSSTDDNDTMPGPSKQRMGRSTTESTNPAQEPLSFFCSKPAGTAGFREAATFQLDKGVRMCAELLQDTKLLA